MKLPNFKRPLSGVHEYKQFPFSKLRYSSSFGFKPRKFRQHLTNWMKLNKSNEVWSFVALQKLPWQRDVSDSPFKLPYRLSQPMPYNIFECEHVQTSLRSILIHSTVHSSFSWNTSDPSSFLATRVALKSRTLTSCDQEANTNLHICSSNGKYLTLILHMLL